MINFYAAEYDPPLLPLVQSKAGLPVRRVQEWLGLHGLGVAIDAVYGPATAAAVSEFQERAGTGVYKQLGQVDRPTWQRLVAPLGTAQILTGQPYGAAVVEIAEAYLKQRAREIGGDNRGPWVRHFCRGPEVAWCQGFASTVWADAARQCELEPPLDLELDGIFCLFVPRMVQEAKAKGLFQSGAGGQARPTPGSMFFLRGGHYGYTHVGIVVSVTPAGLMQTIEGNTNDDGSANGYEVARRVRQVEGSDFAVLP